MWNLPQMALMPQTLYSKLSMSASMALLNSPQARISRQPC